MTSTNVHQMMPTRRLGAWLGTCSIAVLLAAATSGCATPAAAPPYVPPALSVPLRVGPGEGDDVATVSVSTINVLRWSEIVDKLKGPEFDADSKAILTDAVTTTSSVNSSYAETMAVTVAATLAGLSVSKTRDTSVDATGASTTTSDAKRTLTTPAAPTPVAININAPAIGSTGYPTLTAGTDAQLRYQMAKALAERIAIINKEVEGVVIRRGYRPYFVSLQLALHPKQRGFPYDTTADIDLNVIKKAVGANAATDDDLQIVPILVTDSLEQVQDVEVSDIVRQIGAQLQASAHLVGASASFEDAVSRLNQSVAYRQNSLFSIAQLDAGKIQVRLGANQFGSSFEMIPRTHNIALVVLARKDLVEITGDQPTGRALESAIQSLRNTVRVSGTVIYTDALWRSLSDDQREKLRANPLKDTIKGNARIDLPFIEHASCPAQQAVIIAATGVGNAVQASLSGGAGLAFRRVEATLALDIPFSTPKVTKAVVRTADFVSRDASHLNDGTTINFPGVASFLKAPATSSQVGGMKLSVQPFEFDRDVLVCPGTGGSYPVYLAAAAPTPPKDAKPKEASAQPVSVTFTVSPVPAASLSSTTTPPTKDKATSPMVAATPAPVPLPVPTTPTQKPATGAISNQ